MSLKGQPSQQSNFSINSMMGSSGNIPLVNGRPGLQEQRAGLSHPGLPIGPGYRAQTNTTGQQFSPLKTRMRTNPATSLSNNKNNELQQGTV